MRSSSRRIKYLTETGSLSFDQLSGENIGLITRVDGDISVLSKEVDALETFFKNLRHCSELKSIFLKYNARGPRLWHQKRPLKIDGRNGTVHRMSQCGCCYYLDFIRRQMSRNAYFLSIHLSHCPHLRQSCWKGVQQAGRD